MAAAKGPHAHRSQQSRATVVDQSASLKLVGHDEAEGALGEKLGRARAHGRGEGTGGDARPERVRERQSECVMERDVEGEGQRRRGRGEIYRRREAASFARREPDSIGQALNPGGQKPRQRLHYFN